MVDSYGVEALQPSEQTLQLAYCRALELADFKGGFLARTAHELRSPLNKIISLQQMILEGLCDDIEEEREFMAEAHAASLKLLEYLDFLIRISKIEMGRIEPTLSAVSLAEAFVRVQDMNQLSVADRNLRLVVEPPDASIQVWTDARWFQNVMTTLIDIALDSNDRGTIRLRLAPDSPPDTCHLWLEDDRPTTHWQEAATLAHVAEFDLDDSLPASLRMAMVEAMMHHLGGHVSLLAVTSDESPTRLQITLPRSQELA